MFIETESPQPLGTAGGSAVPPAGLGRSRQGDRGWSSAQRRRAATEPGRDGRRVRDLPPDSARPRINELIRSMRARDSLTTPRSERDVVRRARRGRRSAGRCRSGRRTAPCAATGAPPPPARRRGTSRCCATISVVYRLMPSLSSYSRVCSGLRRRPSAPSTGTASTARRLAPGDDAMPLRALLLARRSLSFQRSLVASAEVRDGLAALRVPQLGVAPEVADQDDLVDACHGGGISVPLSSGFRDVLSGERPRNDTGGAVAAPRARGVPECPEVRALANAVREQRRKVDARRAGQFHNAVRSRCSVEAPSVPSRGSFPGGEGLMQAPDIGAARG